MKQNRFARELLTLAVIFVNLVIAVPFIGWIWWSLRDGGGLTPESMVNMGLALVVWAACLIITIVGAAAIYSQLEKEN